MAVKERRARDFVVATMLNPFTLPALGGSILAAVVAGIHLGQSSISLINPIYFQGPALHPRERGAAIEERSLAAQPPADGQLYGWEKGRAARAADCRDCEALQARDAYAYSAEVPYFGSREELRAADAQRPAAQPSHEEFAVEPIPVEEIVDPRSPVLRYAYYPVEQPSEESEELQESVPVVDKYYSE